jgi:hypothetical protein
MTDNTEQETEVVEHDDPKGMFNRNERLELIATITLAIATILTAWSAFQAGKWGGTQSINFSEAGAARTESTRADTAAGQLVQVDISMFIDWITALSEEVREGIIPPLDATSYEPTPATVSGFLYERFRAEFLPAVEAWLATDPTNNPNAPPTPLSMDEYVVAKAVEADQLTTAADKKSQDARDANQHGDNYVLTMVLFASVLFFAGVSTKVDSQRNRLIIVSFGVFLLVTGMIILATFPVLI